jgi:nucleoside-diphosphate-sugar epimerase
MFGTETKISIIKESDSNIDDYFSKSDVFINFASARANEEDKKLYKSISFQFKYIQKLIYTNVPFIINISSQSLYNQKENIVKDEDSIVEINGLYSFQKLIAEEFINFIHRNTPASKVVSLRLGRVIGNQLGKKKPDGFFAKIIESIFENNVIKIPNPSNNINLIDIRDVIDLILFFINYKDKNKLSAVYNVGGSNITIKEYCEKVLDCTGNRSKEMLIQYGESNTVKDSSMIDSKRINKLGWSNNFSIEDSILDIAKFFDN